MADIQQITYLWSTSNSKLHLEKNASLSIETRIFKNENVREPKCNINGTSNIQQPILSPGINPSGPT